MSLRSTHAAIYRPRYVVSADIRKSANRFLASHANESFLSETAPPTELRCKAMRVAAVTPLQYWSLFQGLNGLRPRPFVRPP